MSPEAVRRTRDTGVAAGADVGVDHRCADIVVSVQFLDDANLAPILEEVHGEQVAERMRSAAFGQARATEASVTIRCTTVSVGNLKALECPLHALPHRVRPLSAAHPRTPRAGIPAGAVGTAHTTSLCAHRPSPPSRAECYAGAPRPSTGRRSTWTGWIGANGAARLRHQGSDMALKNRLRAQAARARGSAPTASRQGGPGPSGSPPDRAAGRSAGAGRRSLGAGDEGDPTGAKRSISAKSACIAALRPMIPWNEARSYSANRPQLRSRRATTGDRGAAQVHVGACRRAGLGAGVTPSESRSPEAAASAAVHVTALRATGPYAPL
jgi:hypothetical protein